MTYFRVYSQAARFDDEGVAGEVYFAIEDLLRENRCDLSVYRFLLDGVAHVAVLGEEPGEPLWREIESFLAVGEEIELPEAVLPALLARRETVTKHASWAEGHYRPGRPVADLS